MMKTIKVMSCPNNKQKTKKRGNVDYSVLLLGNVKKIRKERVTVKQRIL